MTRLTMVRDIPNSFLQGAETDLKAAKALVTQGLFSQMLYMVEQALEKSSKGLYAYYLINQDNLTERQVYGKFKEFSHDNSKTIPEIYSKIAEIEEKSLTNLVSSDPKVLKTIEVGLRQLSGLKKSIDTLKNKINKLKNDKIAVERNLISKFPNEVDIAYQNFKGLPLFVKYHAQGTIKRLQFTGTSNATKTHPFLDFIGLTSDLIFCMLIRNDIYRYPHLDYQNENLEMLNMPLMKEPCNKLIEIMEVTIKSIQPLMKTAGLAL
jgi:HEPN domain-containing protein